MLIALSRTLRETEDDWLLNHLVQLDNNWKVRYPDVVSASSRPVVSHVFPLPRFYSLTGYYFVKIIVSYLKGPIHELFIGIN